VGDPRGGFAYPLKDVTINDTYYRQVFGGTLPGPIWRESMQAALGSSPAVPFVLQTVVPIPVAAPPSVAPPREEILEEAENFLFDNLDPGTTGEVPEEFDNTVPAPAPNPSAPPAPPASNEFDPVPTG
jgi:hypothetical protein